MSLYSKQPKKVIQKIEQNEVSVIKRIVSLAISDLKSKNMTEKHLESA